MTDLRAVGRLHNPLLVDRRVEKGETFARTATNLVANAFESRIRLSILGRKVNRVRASVENVQLRNTHAVVIGGARIKDRRPLRRLRPLLTRKGKNVLLVGCVHKVDHASKIEKDVAVHAIANKNGEFPLKILIARGGGVAIYPSGNVDHFQTGNRRLHVFGREEVFVNLVRAASANNEFMFLERANRAILDTFAVRATNSLAARRRATREVETIATRLKRTTEATRGARIFRVTLGHFFDYFLTKSFISLFEIRETKNKK